MRAWACAALIALGACGGGGSSAPTPPTPAPTPTPPPNYSGTYSGVVVYNVGGQGELRPMATITVTHTSSTVTFGNLIILSPVNTQYPMGVASIVGDSFNGAHTYQSSGCGQIRVTTNGRFAGNLINLTAVLIPSGNCGRSEIRGELAR